MVCILPADELLGQEDISSEKTIYYHSQPQPSRC